METKEPIILRAYDRRAHSEMAQAPLIKRVPTFHYRWQSVRYQGKRYQLYGGFRTDYYIDVCNPIKGRLAPFATCGLETL